MSDLSTLAQPAGADRMSGWTLLGRFLLAWMVARFFVNVPLAWLPHAFGGYSAPEARNVVLILARYSHLITGSLALGFAIAFALRPEIRLQGWRASLGLVRYPHSGLLLAFLGILTLVGGTVLATYPLTSFNIGGRTPLFDLRQIQISSFAIFALGAVFAALSEAALRGLAQPALMRHMSVWPAIATTTLLSFGLGAFILAPPIPDILLSLCFAAAVHLFLGWIRYRSGSLWPGLAVHALLGGLMVAVLRS